MIPNLFSKNSRQSYSFFIDVWGFWRRKTLISQKFQFKFLLRFSKHINIYLDMIKRYINQYYYLLEFYNFLYDQTSKNTGKSQYWYLTILVAFTIKNGC